MPRKYNYADNEAKQELKRLRDRIYRRVKAELIPVELYNSIFDYFARVDMLTSDKIDYMQNFLEETGVYKPKIKEWADALPYQVEYEYRRIMTIIDSAPESVEMISKNGYSYYVPNTAKYVTRDCIENIRDEIGDRNFSKCVKENADLIDKIEDAANYGYVDRSDPEFDSILTTIETIFYQYADGIEYE